MKTVRQNFLLPANVKILLDKAVPKGKQSKFVSEAIAERISSKESWKVLDAPMFLDIEHPILYAKNLRTSWGRNGNHT